MSELYSRRSRRADSRQMWDESDRRPRAADRDRDRPREPRPRDDDRDDRRRDRRRYRSRTRSRSRDRRPERDGGRGRRGEERIRPREERRRDDEGRADGRDKRGRERDERRENGPRRDISRDKHRRRSASPRGPPTREDDDDDAYLDPLPTRAKPDSRKAMSFRVGRADSPERDDPRGRSPAHDMEVDDEEEEEDEVEVDDGMADMQAMMGFGGFGTTKGKKVAGNNAYAVSKEKKTVYRQYMNRTKGFNRPLSPTRYGRREDRAHRRNWAGGWGALADERRSTILQVVRR